MNVSFDALKKSYTEVWRALRLPYVTGGENYGHHRMTWHRRAYG